MTRQNWPNLPNGESTTARSPPIPEDPYLSMYALSPSLAAIAVATAAPSISVKRRGKERPAKVQRKTDLRLRPTGW